MPTVKSLVTKTLIAASLFALTLIGFAGCATTEEAEETNTIPWSTPAKWEGGGPLQSVMPNYGDRSY